VTAKYSRVPIDMGRTACPRSRGSFAYAWLGMVYLVEPDGRCHGREMKRTQTKAGLLNSWKEIATYLGCGVRTAQRWERRGLPVRRITGGTRGSVIADAGEVTSWIGAKHGNSLDNVRLSDHRTLHQVLRTSVDEARHQREEMKTLRETRRAALDQLRTTIKKLRDSSSDTVRA
jgi:hypothetical protein